MQKTMKSQQPIESIKEVVKKLKAQGFSALTHHDLAIALVTVGFAEVCKELGTSWLPENEKEALKVLKNSDYQVDWFGRINNSRFSNLIPLCSRGDIEKVKELISTVSNDSKKDLFSTVDNMKRTALHIAVKQNFDILAEYLINEGFSLNARDRELKTPLHYCKNQLIGRVLIDKKAKIIVKDIKHCTPVHYAASGGDYKLLELLLKSANVVNEKDSTGKTALFYSVYNTSEEQINVIRILFQNGADANLTDIYKKNVLHYVVQLGKTRCIPILLKKGTSLQQRDKYNKTPLDYAQTNEKVKKIILAYVNNRGSILPEEQKEKRKQFSSISQKNASQVKGLGRTQQINKQKIRGDSSLKDSGIKRQLNQTYSGQSQIYTQQVNQVSTWVREKFFVLMKKLQQSGVKSMWHLKKPYVFTGSWAEDIDNLQDLYETFLNINGPEAAMRAFNILCPYEKPLPSVLPRAEQAFQSFFGESWFSNDPVEKLRNLHSTTKVRSQLQLKQKQLQDLETQLAGYRSEIQKLQEQLMNKNQELSHYKKVQDELRKQKSKNTQQYTQILRLLAENEQLKNQISSFVGSQQKTKIMKNVVDDLRSKNQGLLKQIQNMKVVQAASRRKCGQIFLKSLRNPSTFSNPQDNQNLYDDDAIISLYNLLRNNPPNLQKRFKLADKRSSNKLSIDEFTQMLQGLGMLPQDVMSMHRITGFAYGRKSLSLQQFKTILENRHKNRPMWQQKLIKKIKTIMLQNGIDLQKFFKIMDKDGNGTIQITQLRQGLQNYNIFMNQNDWSNLFNLLDSDNSGQIDLNQLKVLMDQERTGKLENVSNLSEQKQSNDQQNQQQNENHNENNNDEKDGQYQKNQNEGEKQQNDGENQQEQNAEQEQNHEQQQQEHQDEKDEQGQDENQQQNSEQNEEKQDQHDNQNDQEKGEQQYENQFSQPYEQQDSDQQKGITKINGVLKIQVPQVKIPDAQEQKVYIQFFINQDIDSPDSIKLVDLSKPKQNIVCELQIKDYKVQDLEEFTLNVSLWKRRKNQDEEQLGQQDYLGQIDLPLKSVIQWDPSSSDGKWPVNKRIKLTSERFEKEVKGTVVLQVKWTASQEEEEE